MFQSACGDTPLGENVNDDPKRMHLWDGGRTFEFPGASSLLDPVHERAGPWQNLKKPRGWPACRGGVGRVRHVPPGGGIEGGDKTVEGIINQMKEISHPGMNKGSRLWREWRGDNEQTDYQNI